MRRKRPQGNSERNVKIGWRKSGTGKANVGAGKKPKE
jgi:hypothetical protein